ncbi:MAG: hypothetical protein MUF49_10490 [Oculatellaceae cyanobacterium Prado106]|jgi:hypothetical protein|nr:hypothetical protein [Oculatellaceae cyanobacterium Prado106]
MDDYTDPYAEPYTYSEPYAYSEEAALSQAQTLFPQLDTEFNYAFSAKPILLNGMKVIFDKTAPVYPVNLKKKNEEDTDEG